MRPTSPHFVVTALTLLASFASGAKTVSSNLPSSIVLILPPTTLYANYSTPFSYGVDDTNELASDDLYRSVNFTITHPDGSITQNGALLSSGCTTNPGSVSTFSIPNNVTGAYELTANVTYGIPGGSDCTNLSYQTEIMTFHFTILPSSNNTETQPLGYTTTAAFSSQPTGKYDVPKKGGAVINGVGCFALSTVVGVAALILK